MYEKVLPGTQLVTRMEDRGYRVQSLGDPTKLVQTAEHEKPILTIVDVGFKSAEVCDAIAQLRRNATTAHIPLIALTAVSDTKSQEAARTAGATLVVHDSAILNHLDQFLEQALALD